jgi:hypothetical protein
MNYSPTMKRIVISKDVVVDQTSTWDSKEDHNNKSRYLSSIWYRWRECIGNTKRSENSSLGPSIYLQLQASKIFKAYWGECKHIEGPNFLKSYFQIIVSIIKRLVHKYSHSHYLQLGLLCWLWGRFRWGHRSRGRSQGRPSALCTYAKHLSSQLLYV